jgi:hypothetical protein
MGWKIVGYNTKKINKKCVLMVYLIQVSMIFYLRNFQEGITAQIRCILKYSISFWILFQMDGGKPLDRSGSIRTQGET